MDNQDQRRAHTPGHESHGVHVCHKCGWPFPNPHPSAKYRRAHRKICGTIEGYKLYVSEGQTHLNASDDERLSDDDYKTPGSNALDTRNNEKGSGGIGEKLIRSEDEVFSDAVADFSDGGLSPGVKEHLQDSLDSAIHVERVDIKYPKSSGSSGDNGFSAADVSQLIVKSRDDSQLQNPKILQSERIEDINTLELQGQLSGFTVDPLSSSIADLRTEESTVVRSDVCFGLSSDSRPSKAKAWPDVLPEKKIYADENVADCNLTSVAKETNLKGKDEIKPDRDMVEVVVSSDKVVSETCEGVSKIVGSDVVTLDCQVADGTFNLKEKNSAEFRGDLPIELNSIIITNASTNGVQVESAHMTHFAASIDFKTLQEKGEGNANVFTLPTRDDRPDVAHPQSEYEDFKDHEGVVSRNPLSLHSSEALKHEQDDLRHAITAENDFLFNPSLLSEKSEVLSPDMHVLDSSSMKKDWVSSEPMAEEMHAEESIEVSPVKLTVESNQRLDEIGASMNALKSETNESHMVHFSEEQASEDVCKNSQQISLPEGSFMASSNENPSDVSFGSAASETTSVIAIDKISHHEKNRMEINDVAVDGKCGGANVENDIGIRMKTLPTSDLLHLEVKPSSIFKSDDAGDTSNIEKCDITDAQYTERPIVKDTSLPKSASSHFECPILPEDEMDGSARKLKVIECTSRSQLSGAQEDIKDDEIKSNSNSNVNECNGFVGTSADSHEAQNAELLAKAAEDLARKTLLSSSNIEPSTEHVPAVEDNQDGEPIREVSGITAVPVQDQSGNNFVKLASSGIDTSVNSGSRCDSLEGNWGSVSVLSMQSDAQAVIDAEALPSTDLAASTVAGNDPKATSERQQSEKPEMFEPPSFMTLVEPGHVVGPKAAASEVQKGPKPQQPNSTSSQAGWFPTITHVTNESQGRKKNEEIIAKVTNWSTTKQHTPLKNLLGEAAHGNKSKSPKVEENSVKWKNGKVPEDNGCGLTTVNSVLGPESPAAQAMKGEGGKEWNSSARYPADLKREKKKVKSRPYWIQFVCCSSVDPQRR